MKTFVITMTDPTYGELGPRQDRARVAREAVGVHAIPFFGIHAARLGLSVLQPYVLNPRESLSSKNVGTWLSHRSLWAACLLMQDSTFLLLEDDALFPVNWRARFIEAVSAVPAKGWDLINFGACCAVDKPKQHFKGPLYTMTAGPMCLHAYLVKREALRVLCESLDAAGIDAPVDIAAMLYAYPKLKTFVVLPRVVSQIDLETLPQ